MRALCRQALHTLSVRPRIPHHRVSPFACCLSTMKPEYEGADKTRINTLQTKGWKHAKADDQGRETLSKEFNFKGFKRAFAFMQESARKAIAINHHPEWFNVYAKVTVTLTTHAANNTLTMHDILLAEAMEESAVTATEAPLSSLQI